MHHRPAKATKGEKTGESRRGNIAENATCGSETDGEARAEVKIKVGLSTRETGVEGPFHAS